MPDPNESQLLGSEARGRAATETLAYTGDFLERKSADIDREAFALLRSPEGMTPEKAVALWMRKLAIRDLVADIRDAAQVGERAAAALAKTRQAPPTRDPLP